MVLGEIKLTGGIVSAFLNSEMISETPWDQGIDFESVSPIDQIKLILESDCQIEARNEYIEG